MPSTPTKNLCYFVARQFLSQNYALFGVLFAGQKVWWRTKITHIRYEYSQNPVNNMIAWLGLREGVKKYQKKCGLWQSGIKCGAGSQRKFAIHVPHMTSPSGDDHWSLIRFGPFRQSVETSIPKSPPPELGHLQWRFFTWGGGVFYQVSLFLAAVFPK